MVENSVVIEVTDDKDNLELEPLVKEKNYLFQPINREKHRNFCFNLKKIQDKGRKELIGAANFNS